MNLSEEHLRQYIERLESLDKEKKNITDDVKSVLEEAKGTGFCTKTIRKILQLRKLDDNEVIHQQHLLDTYRKALGMLPE